MKRLASVIGMPAENREEYERLHAAVWPAARSGNGRCSGSQTDHHSCVAGSAAIAAMSASKSSPTYSM